MNLVPAAYAGMADAIARAERASTDLVNSFSGGQGEPAAALVDLLQAKTQFRASAAAVHVADEMMASLLDIQRACG